MHYDARRRACPANVAYSGGARTLARYGVHLLNNGSGDDTHYAILP
jgi:hypothetical protein